MDLLVEGSVVVQLKSVEELLPIHEAQLLSYLRLGGCRLSVLINFNVVHPKDGIKRMVHNSKNSFPRSPASSASSAMNLLPRTKPDHANPNRLLHVATAAR